ncbi:Rpp20 subunit of nuclear RNase MRP and P [Plasmodiophora brassicae]
MSDCELDILYDAAAYKRIKRAPLRAEARSNDIYVRRGTSRANSLRMLGMRARRLLFDDKVDVVRIYGIGAAIPTAIDVALDLQRTHTGITLRPVTSSVTVHDEFDPRRPDLEPVTLTRIISQICIEVSRVS